MHPTRVYQVIRSLILLTACGMVGAAHATGKAKCDAADKTAWQAPAKLQQQLQDKGWQVRKVKEDGGCYEVYALDDKGQKVEAYFHPVTLAPVQTRP